MDILDKNYIFVGDNLRIMTSEKFKDVVSSVDTIYIDPPYNTKHRFVYDDKKDRPAWISFMRDRLTVARSLLKPEGVIFISIDDNEFAYLKTLCDAVFGDNNFVGTFITNQSQRSNSKHINIVHEYILCYAKEKKNVHAFKVRRMSIPEDRHMITKIADEIKQTFKTQGEEQARQRLKELIKYWCRERNITWLKNYNSIDEEGNVYYGQDLSTPRNPVEVCIPEIGLKLKPLPTRGWSTPKKFLEAHNNGRLIFKNGRPYEKRLLTEAEDNASSLLNFYSRQGKHDLDRLGLRDLFDTPKPVGLIKHLIRMSTPENGTVLDFFGGSGTTAQAVYEINQEDNTNRHYVLIQIDEEIPASQAAYSVCLQHRISPRISDAMIYRIKTFLAKHDDIEGNYEIIV